MELSSQNSACLNNSRFCIRFSTLHLLGEHREEALLQMCPPRTASMGQLQSSSHEDLLQHLPGREGFWNLAPGPSFRNLRCLMGGLEVGELLGAKWPTQGSDEGRQVADGFLFFVALCRGGVEGCTLRTEK